MIHKSWIVMSVIFLVKPILSLSASEDCKMERKWEGTPFPFHFQNFTLRNGNGIGIGNAIGIQVLVHWFHEM